MSRRHILRSTAAAAAVTVVGLAAFSQLNPAGAADSLVARPSAAAVRAVPALEAPAVAIPAGITKVLSGGTGLVPDATANPELARPIKARIPGAATSWVVPTERGACLVLVDTDNSISVGCETSDRIASAGLAATVRGADAAGKPEASGLTVGIGGPSADIDGSFVRATR